MKIAIITGASAGLGQELLKHAVRHFPEIEEFWLIARSRERLEATTAAFPDTRFRLLPLDLCKEECITELAETLQTVQPELQLLINNAGCGYLNKIGDGPLQEQMRMIDLNLRALTAVTHIALPCMPRGSRIINIASIAAFCPNARMTVYSAGKSYVLAFSRGLGDELKSRGISVTAVCPGPMDTSFIYDGNIKGHSKTFDTLPYCDPVKVAEGAIKAARRGKSVYTPKVFYKLYRLLAKLLPQRFMIPFART